MTTDIYRVRALSWSWTRRGRIMVIRPPYLGARAGGRGSAPWRWPPPPQCRPAQRVPRPGRRRSGCARTTRPRPARRPARVGRRSCRCRSVVGQKSSGSRPQTRAGPIVSSSMAALNSSAMLVNRM